MTDPITLPVKDARELVYNDVGEAFDGWTVVAITDDDSGRWTSYHRLVIRDEQGRHYVAGFERGLTEYQDTGPFECDERVEFRPVFPDVRTVEVTEWVDQPPAPAAEPTPEQAEAERIIRSAVEDIEMLTIAEMAAADTDPDRIDDLIRSATVTVTWEQGAEQAGGS